MSAVDMVVEYYKHLIPHSRTGLGHIYLRSLVDEFNEALTAAHTVDRLLLIADPPYEDEDELVANVTELERHLKASRGEYVLRDGDWYVMTSGAYTTLQSEAHRYVAKELAEAAALEIAPIPKVVKIVRRK
jgi:23S rRNA A2030 N6-methylase RlmJ